MKTPVAWMQTFEQEYKGVREIKHAVNIEQIGINDIALYDQSTIDKLDAENKALKAFVKPILVHGGDGVGDWDGYELQELAAKSGLFISKMMKEPCNLGNEDKLGCLCREYCYGEDEWECYRINAFLLEDEK